MCKKSGLFQSLIFGLKSYIWHVLVTFNHFLYWIEKHSVKRSFTWHPAASCYQKVGADKAPENSKEILPAGVIKLALHPYSGKTGVSFVKHVKLSFLPHSYQYIIENDRHGRLVFVRNRFGIPIDIGYPQAWLPHRLTAKKLGESATLTGRVALLGAYWGDCNNYYHFISDTLGDLAFLQSQGIDLRKIDYFVMPFSGVSWQVDLWRKTGLSFEKIMPVSRYSDLKLTELIVPIRAKGSTYTPTWLPLAVRALLTFKPTFSPAAKRLYISRKDATNRAMLNEDEVIAVLQQQNFTVLECSTLSVAEQQFLFCNAELIVAPHGAALTNLIWCMPQTVVIELMPSANTNRCFVELCMHLGLEHFAMLGVLSDSLSNDCAFRFDNIAALLALINTIKVMPIPEGIR